MKRFMFIVFVALLCSCNSGEHKQEGETACDSLELVFTGDLLLDRGVRPLVERHGVEWLLDNVSPLFRKADAAIVNLECPLTDVVTPQPKQFVFRADVCWADGLHKAGITHASMANNHSVDQGFQGVESTYRSLTEVGITPLGCGKTRDERLMPCVISKGEVTVAIFASVMFPIESWIANPVDKYSPCQSSAEELSRTIVAYHDEHPEHRIIAYLHWGVEYQETPVPQQRMQARMLVAAGADVIIGHHPHVIQPLGYVADKPVFYSLGHLVFDSTRPQGNKGQIARLVVKADTIMAEAIDIKIERCKPDLPPTPSLQDGE